MEMLGDVGIGYKIAFGVDFDLFGTEQIEYVFGLQPALV